MGQMTELEYFSAYLPYGLKVIDNNDKYIFDVDSVSVHGLNMIVSSLECSFSDVKLLLYPLSALTEENCPVNLLGHRHAIMISGDNYRMRKSSVGFYKFLIKNKYDLFNLISQGLAINVNELKINPYE